MIQATLGCLNDLEVCICIIYLCIYVYIILNYIVYKYVYKYIDFVTILVASSAASMAYWLRCWIPNATACAQNHWTAPRLTQTPPFILPRLVK